MNAEQASEYAIEHGGASFSICPVCDEHFTDGPVQYDLSDPDRLRARWGDREPILRAHAESHTVLEYVTAIVERDREIARLKDQVTA